MYLYYIQDASSDRWEVPEWLIPRPNTTTSSPDYDFTYTSSPFGFAVTRKSDNSVIFNTTVPRTGTWNGLQFKDQFLSISTQLDSNSNLYGLQESTQSAGFKLTQKTYTLWNHDTPAASTNTNLYGAHPFYLQILENGKSPWCFLIK